jgi:triosephosphate isomerase
MARRQFVAGNWKMHKTVSEAVAFVGELRQALASIRDCDIAVAPPYLAIHPVAEKLKGSNIAVSGQEIFFEDKGAFTGAVSGPMLKEAGCMYSLIAHSERRQYFGETNETSNKRLRATLRAGLVPILCVGETLAEREAGRTNAVVEAQLTGALTGTSVTELANLVVAYEPVWAIGTGKVATPAQAQEVHAFIRERLSSKDGTWARVVRILYGGSVKPDNAAELLSQPDIDGGLVGGAALDVASFVGIVKGSKANKAA